MIKTVDIVSLHHLADCLHRQLPSLRQAMAMDGGASSDVIASQDLLHAARETAAQAGWRALLARNTGVHILFHGHRDQPADPCGDREHCRNRRRHPKALTPPTHRPGAMEIPLRSTHSCFTTL